MAGLLGFLPLDVGHLGPELLTEVTFPYANGISCGVAAKGRHAMRS